MNRFFKILFATIVLILLYFLFYPTGMMVASWNPPKAPELVGEYQKNNTLSQTEVIYRGKCDRCEDIAIDRDGNIYGGEINGNIKMFEKGSPSGRILANTGGRPLGLHFDKDGNLIIADAYKGVLSLSKDGELKTLTDSHGDYKFRFADDLDIDSSGVIYFTDAANRFQFRENNKNIIEHQPSGAFYKYDPLSGKTTLLIDSMYFANGVAIHHEEEFVLINETTTYQLRKY